MAPGQNNGKNYGGLHTGDGKKQHTGIYNTGYRFKLESHTKYVNGTTVYHKKTGNKGVVIPKDKKVPRSMIHVKFRNKNMYCYTSMLYTEGHLKNLQRTVMNKGKSIRKKNKVTEKSKEKLNNLKERKKREESDRNRKIIENKKKRLEFRKFKKEFNKTRKEGVYVDISTNKDGKTTTIFNKLPPTNNDLINDSNEKMYKRAVEFNKNTHKNKLLTDFIIPKDRQLELIQLTNCGSTQNLINVSNKGDFYKYIESYMLSKNNI